MRKHYFGREVFIFLLPFNHFFPLLPYQTLWHQCFQRETTLGFAKCFTPQSLLLVLSAAIAATQHLYSPAKDRPDVELKVTLHNQKIFFFPLRFSVNVTDTDIPEYVSLSTLCGEGGAKAFLRKKPATPKSPEHIPPALPKCQKLCREKGDTNCLKVCISFYQSVTEPRRRQLYGHFKDAHLATRQQGITVPPGK